MFTNQEFRVVAYLPDYRCEHISIESTKHLTDLIYFSVSPNDQGELSLEKTPKDHLKKLKTIREKYKTKLHLCVGGWNRSNGFTALSASPMARKKLIDQLLGFCEKNDFSGVDIDWEHPDTHEQQVNHGILLAEIKKAFAEKKLRLTIAVAGWQQLENTAIEAVDAIHLMAYDDDGKHSTYDFAVSDIDRLVKKKVLIEKIVLGVPFYGRSIANRERSMTYAEIVKRWKPKPDVDEIDGIYFNGPDMISKKTKLAKERKCAGIMIWEIGQDVSDENGLLAVIHNAVNRK